MPASSGLLRALQLLDELAHLLQAQRLPSADGRMARDADRNRIEPGAANSAFAELL